MNGQEALGLAGRFKRFMMCRVAGRLATVLRAIVQALVLSMLHARHDNSLRDGIASKLIRDHHARSSALLLE